jgi:hypothetical protein
MKRAALSHSRGCLITDDANRSFGHKAWRRSQQLLCEYDFAISRWYDNWVQFPREEEQVLQPFWLWWNISRVKLFQTSRQRKEKGLSGHQHFQRDEKQGLCTETLEATSSANNFVASGWIYYCRGIGHTGLTLA